MILEIIVLTIFIASIFNVILNKFKMPTIIGYIITGSIISYIFDLHNLAATQELKMIAEFGIAFLMFTIGLEFSVNYLIKMRKNVFVFWGIQFFATSIVFYLLSYIVFWFDVKQSIIISLWLTLSSTAIVLKILNENGDINKYYWNRTLWILIFQDLMVIPILILITVFSTNDTNIWLLISSTIGSVLILFITLWLIGRYALDHFLYKVANTKSNEIFIWSILFIILWSSALSHFLWFSYSLGAFIAGMLIAETHYKHQVQADLIPFRDLLLGFFFITVWMQLNFGIISNYMLEIIWLICLLFLIKFSIFYSILMWFSHKRSAFKTAITLFQFWEFWIVIFELATINNLLDPLIWQILLVIIIISMFLTPIILKHLENITDLALWKKNSEKDWEEVSWNLEEFKKMVISKFENHTILIWYWRVGRLIWKKLEKKKINYIIIENDIKIYRKAKKEWKPIIFWNAFQWNTLKFVNIKDAETIFISIWVSERLFLVVDVVKKLNIKWNIIVKVSNYDDEEQLKDLNIKNIVVESEKTATAMFNKMKKIASKKE